MFLGSEAPVADAYTIRAFGNLFWISSTARPVLVGFPDPEEGNKFFALWHSSNTMTPSKSSPHHWTNCPKRELYFPETVVDSLIKEL